MLKSQQIREQRGALHDKVTALTALAEKETRDLTDEELTEFDEIKGKYEALNKDLARAQWLEDEAERLAAARINTRLEAGDDSGNPERPLRGPEANDYENLAATIKLPTGARAEARQLRNFNGEYAAERAYIAGQWLFGAVFGYPKQAKWCQDHGLEIHGALGGSDNRKGGVLVPTEFSSELIVLQEQYGIFRQKASRWPMASEKAQAPRLLSGVTVYFVGENDEITASDVTTDMVQLNARKLAALVKWPSELDDDSMISIADLLAQQIAYAMAVKEDACGFLGTGASTYGGIEGLITACATATATIVTAADANTAFSSLDLDDFEAMIGKLPEFPGINPEWYISKAGWAASMMRLADAAGGNTAEDIEGMRRKMFLGFPVNIVQTMNSTLTAQTSTNGICYFGDLAMAATMGTRREIEMSTTRDRYFETDQIGIKGTERYDINVHDVGDTTDPGAMIMLATPAS